MIGHISSGHSSYKWVDSSDYPLSRFKEVVCHKPRKPEKMFLIS